jgi:hypothetical protein
MHRVARRETIVAARLNMEQLVEWISIGHPGCALLLAGEEIAVTVEGKGDGKAHAGGHDFAARKVRRDLEHGGAFGGEGVLGFPLRIEQVGLVVGLDAEREVDVALAIEAQPMASTFCGISFQPVATTISSSARSSPFLSTMSESLPFDGTNTPSPRA